MTNPLPDRDADVLMPTITVNLTSDEASVVRAAARQTGMTMTQFVAWAVGYGASIVGATREDER